MNAIGLRPMIVVLLATLYLTASASAYRQKRLSDTRLAELETQMSLKKLRDEQRMQKPGFGLRDPHQIGRKRRAPNSLMDVRRLDGDSRERPLAWYPGLERLFRASAAAYKPSRFSPQDQDHQATNSPVAVALDLRALPSLSNMSITPENLYLSSRVYAFR
ncbi:Hypothetical protein NTJ_07708 [Nesidiocoris tenuis]|uniref:Corticotropin-releasing factor domain-containing protein n=1 Tax=Nesidiocoris tenuis TaxID=355587 RepID=A0ABN7ARR4_9HEMI|nr:Hypothetical protein NTJ_07708 [Nesidiocoris tenuis]